ncbi:J domain-containing protein [bacterium]|nr:J domain-containing protein [bacterium]
MKFQDYYETLEVSRDASQADIKKAFKKQARLFHPDVNKEPGAEDKFKQVNEAYEVLGDEQKRRQYDALGANWKNGQEFRPPPNWEDLFGGQFGGGRETSRGQAFGGGGGFSDFFEAIFGSGGFQQAGSGGTSYRDPFGQARAVRGSNLETSIHITLAEAFSAGTKKVSFDLISTAQDGRRQKEKKSFNIKIPKGIQSGKVIRLAKQGAPGSSGGEAGDLLIRVFISEDSRFVVSDKNLLSDIQITPWEAALGTSLPIKTIDGTVTLKVPAGSQSGQKLRVKGKGYFDAKGNRGDLLLSTKIVVPKDLTKEEKELFEKLSNVSQFNPRDE